MIQPNLHRLRRPMLTASLSFLLFGVAACGSDSKTASTTPVAAATVPATVAAPAATTGATTAAAGAGAGTAIAVGESEFKIELPQTTFTAGTYTFNISNTGQFKHNLIVEGNGTKVQSDTFNGGASGTLSVPLTAGTYEVYCGVPTHKGKGMDLTITVT